jgi:hypothetical protein
MAETMLATTGNSTSIHFGMGHQCFKHNMIFTLDHIVQCDDLIGCEKIREYANKLKHTHILDWDKEERLAAITAFALLTAQMQNLTQQHRAAIVLTQPASSYIKTGKKRGRPSIKDTIAKNNTKLS